MDLFYPVQIISNWLTFEIFKLSPDSRLASSLNFFVYDLVKIVLLLLAISYVMSIINAYFPINKVRNFFSNNKLFGLEYLAAALLGTITPFCSCSSIPLFIGFLKGGIPFGVTLTFLISSPLVDSVVVALLLAAFGLKITLIYVLTGIAISIIAGYLLGKMNLEKHLEPWVLKIQSADAKNSSEEKQKNNIYPTAWIEAWEILKTVFLYLALGVAVGAVIHGYVPAGFFAKYLHGIWSIPVATLAAVPLYSNAAGIVPIGQALVDKGVPLGAVLAFMMAAVGLSVPSGIMLKKVMSWKLLFIFFGVVTLAIIFSGYFFNLII